MSLVGSYAFYGKLLHDLFVTGQAKVEIVRAANVVIEQVVGTVEVRLTGATIMMPVDIQGSTIMMPIDIQGATIMMPVDIQAQYMDIDVRITGQVGYVKISIQEVAEDVVINIRNTAETAIYVRTESGVAINVKTESEVVLNIWTPSGKWATKAEPSTFGEVKESYYAIGPSSRLLLHVVNGERGVLRTIGFMIAWSDLTYTIDEFDKLQIEIYADQDPDAPGATPVWQSTSIGVDLLSGGYAYGGKVHNLLNTNAINKLAASSDRGGLTWAYVNSNGYITACGGYIYVNVECMSDIYVVFKNLHSGETLKIWYAIEYGVYP